MNEERYASQLETIKTLRWVWHVMTARPLQLIALTSCFLLAALCDVFTPILVSNFIASFETDFDPQRSLYLAGLMVFVGWILFDFCNYIGLFINKYYQTASMAKIINDLHWRVQNAPFDWHVNQHAGSSVVKVTRSSLGFENFADNIYSISGLIPAIFVALGATTVLALKYPIIGLGIGALMIFGAIFLVWLTLYYVGPANRKAINEENKIGGYLSDRLSNNILIKSFSRERQEFDSLKTLVSKWRVFEYDSWERAHQAALVYGFFRILAVIFGAYMSVQYVDAGRMPLSDVALVFITILMINAYTRRLGEIFLNMRKSLSDLEDGANLVELETEESNNEHGGTAELTLDKSITIKNLNFAYPSKSNSVLNIPDFEICCGERIGLIGHSGAGKSTLVSLIMRFYNIEDGEIAFDDQNINALRLSDLRQNIAVIPQDTTLFHRSLMDNIRYGNPQATDEEVIEASKKARAHDFISDLPEGYETLVGERGVKLSGGQRQRIAIARAILKDAPILILDEATSALDSESERLIQDSLQKLMDDKTVIAIAHRLSTINHLDRLIVMDQGRIVEDGTHEELLSKNGLYAKLWSMQSGGFLGE